MMKRTNAFVFAGLSLAVAGLGTPFSVSAQGLPPSYTASPDIYKLIAENSDFRVISVSLEADQSDHPHSHGGPYVAYGLTYCKLEFTGADGKSVIRDQKAGSATLAPLIVSHSVKNVGTTKCDAVIVERK
jgi:hypothetical protein